jgi:hypothetical protein
VLRPTDTVSVVLAEHAPRAVTPLPVPRDALAGTIERLRKEKPGLSRANIPDAVQRVREIVGRGRNTRKLILVLSDGQRSNWKPTDASAWTAALGQRVKGVEPTVKMYELPIAPAAGRPNLSVGELVVSPPVVGLNRLAAISATVVNAGTGEVAATSARLLVDGREVARQPLAALPAAQSRTIRFEHTFTDPNSRSVEVRVDAADGLDADNAAAPARSSGRRCRSWSSTASCPAPAWTRAGRSRPCGRSGGAGSWPRHAVGRPDGRQPDADQADARRRGRRKAGDDPAGRLRAGRGERRAAVAGRHAEQAAGLRPERARRVVRPRPRHRTGLVRDQLAAANLLHLDVADQQVAAERPVGISVADAGHVTLAPFASPERNGLAGMTTLKWWSVKPRDPDAKVMLATEGGDPLMFERPVGSNGGRSSSGPAPSTARAGGTTGRRCGRSPRW